MLPPHSLPLAALVALLALPAAALAVAHPAEAASGAEARAAATRTVKVADDFYSPKRLTVAKGTTIRWTWSNRNANRHDVFMYRKPSGVRRFHSPSARTSFSVKRKLRKAGTYRFLCTFHDMRMRVSVTR